MSGGRVTQAREILWESTLKMCLWWTHTFTSKVLEHATDRWQMPQGVSYFLCCKTGHHKKTPECLLLCLSMCQRERQRERKRKLARQMTWLHHTTSLFLSFIKKLSLSPLFPIYFTHFNTQCTHTHTSSQAEQSGYSGWCYSRCGVIEVSMLWPCYPGKRESIRSMPGEEETLYQKHILPWGCITAAIWLQTKTFTYIHVHRHLYTYMHLCTKCDAFVSIHTVQYKTFWWTANHWQ